MLAGAGVERIQRLSDQDTARALGNRHAKTQAAGLQA
jgi:hypothetical protein